MSRRELLFSAAAGMALAKSPGAVARRDSDVKDLPDDQVFELRQYTLHRRQRDTLISLFERSFIEPQNEAGAHVVGVFRDLDDPDRFVWMRSFRDMSSRQEALAAFYEGPVWQANRTTANSTMLDSDNVLMLRPAETGEGDRAASEATHSGGFHAKPLAAPASNDIVGATIHYLRGVDSAKFTRFFEDAILPQLTAAGIQPFARLVSEESPNNYPRLPIREHDRVFIWFARWPGIAAEEEFVSKFSAVSGWRDAAPEGVLPALMQKPERLRLAPTARSPLR